MLYRRHSTNIDLINTLKSCDVISSSLVEKVMKMVDRKFFALHEPYDDCPQSIGFNATISAPHIHAHALEFFKSKLIEPRCKALDVGCGSGFLTLCMSLMVGVLTNILNDSKGLVVGIDHFSELVDLSIKNIKNAGFGDLLEKGAIKLETHDGREGYLPESPYDVIYVGAAAQDVPKILLDQIAIGGKMMIPVGNFHQELQVYERLVDGSIRATREFGVRFVPLTDKYSQYPVS
ncbi:Protein-L-isoaspartate(D-aspartate) O-methyltransferase [Thelohanellus kitauei]|uniref:protein-L-isoaspartate(D-aspartate) O-methyltransferase n=1 Tax=Thelohanellus kitauei TaxID=669202 RepID=A0A0C2MYV8_THEKT|nr:Protein-L-isoaspartate(D-aspartate) O-methyltransferase [Thelohanellus kitauei]